MIRKSLISLAALATAFVLAPAATANADVTEVANGKWSVYQGKDWYSMDDGNSFPSSGAYKIGNTVYGFDSDGYLAGKGWFHDADGDWYFLNSSSVPITGWLEYGGEWYYLDPDNYGEMYTSGWRNIGGNDYYFYSDGSMATSTVVSDYGYNYDKKQNETLYYLVGEDGVAIYTKGWQLMNDEYYYVTDTGKGYLLTNTWKGDYFVTGDGSMAKYPEKCIQSTVDGKTVYSTFIDSSYNSGYIEAADKTYKRYQFGYDGKLIKGWYKTSSVKNAYPSYVYSNSKGEITDGWIKSGNDYYLSINGYIVRGGSASVYQLSGYDTLYFTGNQGEIYCVYDQNTKKYVTYKKTGLYYFDEYGKMITGTYKYADYSDSSYWKPGSTVYTDKNGIALNGWGKLNGKDVFYKNGYLIKSEYISEYGTKDGKYINYNQGYWYDDNGDYVSLSTRQTFYFDENGYLVKGLYNRSSDPETEYWIYAYPSGRLANNEWVEISGKYYFFGDYRMYTDRYVYLYESQDKKYSQYNSRYYYDENNEYHYLRYTKAIYYVKEDGSMLKGWFNVGDSENERFIYATASGRLACDEFIKIGEKYYYFDDQIMATSSYVYEYKSEDGKVTKYNQSYYYDENDNYVSLELANKYYIKEDGTMLTGWYNCGSDTYEQWMYADASGRLANEFALINGKYYYFDYFTMTSEKVIHMYKSEDGSETYYRVNSYFYHNDYSNGLPYFCSYYIKEDGTLLVNSVLYVEYNGILGANASGVLYEDGWANIAGKYYYFDYFTAEFDCGRTIDDNLYFFRKDGSMVTGWYQLSGYSGSKYSYEGDWVYAKASGIAADGWTKIGDDWYVFKKGYPVSGLFNDYNTKEYVLNNPYPTFNYDDYDNSSDLYSAKKEYDISYNEWNIKYNEYKAAHTYVLDRYGKLVNGWYKENTSSKTIWYYADSDGHAYTGWIKSSGKDYYIFEGIMQTNKYIGNYYVGSDGAYVA